MSQNSSQNIIFGRNPVKEAIRANKAKSVMLLNGFKDVEVLKLIEERHISVTYCDRNRLDAISNKGVHQGIAAEIKPYSYASFEEILHKASKKERPIVVLLDGISDPHNLGAIMRSADIFDVSGIIVPKRNQVPLTATVSKTSAGAINFVPVAAVSNLTAAIRELKEKGFWVVSADGSGTTDYNSLTYDFPTALVIGNEGDGISRLVLENSDYIVRIPMYGKVNSLNASVACGILLSKIHG